MTVWAPLAFAGGLGLGWLLGARRRRAPRRGPPPRPADFSHTLDLLRRAYGGRAAWAVGLAAGPLTAIDASVPSDARRRGDALVQLACVDGRVHVVRDPDGTYVAVGDFPFGAGVLLAPGTDPAAAGDDLRRVVASMRVAESAELQSLEGSDRRVAKQLTAALALREHTVAGITSAVLELVQRLTERGAVVVLQDEPSRELRVIARSGAADQRLERVVLSPASPVARAVTSGVPIATEGREDIFGPGVPERRRQERAGTAYPLLDGHFAIGALVLIGAPLDPETTKAEQVGRLVAELGPRLAAARAVEAAEQRAVLDPLTGLYNRREFEAKIDAFRSGEGGRGRGAATLVYVDIDHFKKLNDSLGHAAGDKALQHVAEILLRQVRDHDTVARIGGEEFALWLPHTPAPLGIEVAERVRGAIETTIWHWDGAPRPLTASCGVASYPECAPDNLRALADAALYRAKQAGRNRVEKAAAPS
jgi:diguanylate cyclase (GGDEF)-like protein